jgi:hypothetical protein
MTPEEHRNMNDRNTAASPPVSANAVPGKSKLPVYLGIAGGALLLLIVGVVVGASAGRGPGASAAARPPEIPAAVQRAARVVRSEGRMIMSWTYPTVTFQGVTGCEWAGATGGYALSCRLAYADPDGERSSRLLVFAVDEQGLLRGVRDGGGTSSVPAFFVVRMAKEVIARMARESFDQQAKNDELEQAFVSLLANGPEPEEVLTFLLNLKLRAGA